MRPIRMMLTGALMLTGAAGCAATQGASSGGADAAPVQVGPASLEEGQTLGALPEASIPADACGMILWTVSSQRPIPVFRFISGKTAEIQLSGQVVPLSLANVAGDSGFGVFEDQVFQSADGLVVEVNANFSTGFAGGAYLESGVIRMRDAAGWSAVTPAAGIAGCR